MKRFLILFTLIAFVTVSCAGPAIYRQAEWVTIPVYSEAVWIKSEDEFEKDRKECADSIDKNLSSEDFGKDLEECMSKKGYQFKIMERVEEPPSGNKVLRTAAGIALLIVLSPLIIVYGVLLLRSPP